MTIEREEEGRDRSGPLPSTSNHLSGNVQGEHFQGEVNAQGERCEVEVESPLGGKRQQWKVLCVEKRQQCNDQ